jgi:hypothetical protein
MGLIKFIWGLIMGLSGIAMLGAFSLVGGTIVYWLWPVAIPAALPGLVENGVLAASLPWWPAVCLTWLCGLLIKSSQTNNNKTNDKKTNNKEVKKQIY